MARPEEPTVPAEAPVAPPAEQVVAEPVAAPVIDEETFDPQPPTEQFNEVVWMVHDGIDGVTETTRAQFDAVWSKSGWTETTDPSIVE